MFSCMYHIPFLQSFVSEHLGCSHSLAVVNSVAMNVGVQISPPQFILKN